MKSRGQGRDSNLYRCAPHDKGPVAPLLPTRQFIYLEVHHGFNAALLPLSRERGQSIYLFPSHITGCDILSSVYWSVSATGRSLMMMSLHINKPDRAREQPTIRTCMCDAQQLSCSRCLTTVRPQPSTYALSDRLSYNVRVVYIRLYHSVVVCDRRFHTLQFYRLS